MILSSSLKFHSLHFLAEATTWWARAAARQSCTCRTEVGLMVDEGIRMVFSFRVQKGYSQQAAEARRQRIWNLPFFGATCSC